MPSDLNTSAKDGFLASLIVYENENCRWKRVKIRQFLSSSYVRLAYKSKLSICLKYFYWFFDVDIIPNQKVSEFSLHLKVFDQNHLFYTKKIIWIKKSFQLLNNVLKRFFPTFKSSLLYQSNSVVKKPNFFSILM